VIEVRSVAAADLCDPLRLLEESLRGGEPVPEAFAKRLRESVEAGDVQILVARLDGVPVGVAVVAYRLNVSLAGMFASVEDLYVVLGFRRRGVGRALLEAAREHWAERGVSYVEAQVEDEEAMAFYEALGYQPEPGVQVLSRSFVL
jgi:GNAT superfamily N-acetyltransferase